MTDGSVYNDVVIEYDLDDGLNPPASRGKIAL